MSKEVILEVNYDDPRWQGINKDDYQKKVSSFLKSNTPLVLGRGIQNVKFTMYYMTKRYMSTREILSGIRSKGLRCPDRSEAETFFDNEDRHTLFFNHIAFLGPRAAYINGLIPTIEFRRNGRFITLSNNSELWINCVFLAVCPRPDDQMDLF